MNNCPLKVRMFLWLVAKDAILTQSNLQKRDWQGPSFCVLWKGHGEDTSYLYLTCPFSSHVWSKCATKIGIRIDNKEAVDIWHRIQNYNHNHSLANLCRSRGWNIWQKRNNRIFNHSSLSIDGCVCRDHSDLSFWTGQLSDSQRLSITNDKDNYLQDTSSGPNNGPLDRKAIQHKETV